MWQKDLLQDFFYAFCFIIEILEIDSHANVKKKKTKKTNLQLTVSAPQWHFAKL